MKTTLLCLLAAGALPLAASADTQTFTITFGDFVFEDYIKTFGDAPGAGIIESVESVDEYKFTGAAGQQILVLWPGVPAWDVGWTIVNPSGSRLTPDLWIPDAGEPLVLKEDGLHTLRVFPYADRFQWFGSPSGPTYRFLFLGGTVPPKQTFPIAFGDTVSPGFVEGTPTPGAGAIEQLGAVDEYTFVGARDQQVYLETPWSSSSYYLEWQVYLPDGQLFWGPARMDRDSDVLTLPQGGTYTVRVYSPRGLGEYSFTLWGWTAPPKQSFALSIGESVSNGLVGGTPRLGAGNLEASGAVDEYIFEGLAGQSILLHGLGNSLESAGISWTLLGPDGSRIKRGRLSNAAVLDLAATGTYVVRFGFDDFRNADYSFRLSHITVSQTFTITPGDEVIPGTPGPGAGVIEEYLAVDRYRFTGRHGEVIYVDFGGMGRPLNWSLEDPDGQIMQLTEWNYYYGIGPLEKPGTYQLLVSEPNAEPGAPAASYRVWLGGWQQTETFPIALGDYVEKGRINGANRPGAGLIEDSGATDMYVFSAMRNQRIRIESSSTIFWEEGPEDQLFWLLLAPDGSRLYQRQPDGDSSVALTLPQDGTYRLRCYSWPARTTSYELEIRSLRDALTVNQGLGTTGWVWRLEGDAPWFPDPYDGWFDNRGGVRSGFISDNQQSVLATTVTGPGTLAFWWRASCEEEWDYLEFLVNGEVKSSLTGFSGWVQYSVELQDGPQQLQWRYRKDAAGSDLEDAGWVSGVEFKPTRRAPFLIGQPAGRSIIVGDSVTFQAEVGGDLPLTFRWHFNDTPLTDGPSISGSFTASLTVANAQPSHAGAYHLRITNPWGEATSEPAILSVIVPPAITTQPRSLDATPGGDVLFSVGTSGTSPLSYRWLINETPVPNGSGANLRLTGVQPTAAGDYRVIVTNAGGSVTSVVARLTLRPAGLLARDLLDYLTGPIAGQNGGTGFREPYTGNGTVVAGKLRYMDATGAELLDSANRFRTASKQAGAFRFIETNGVPANLLGSDGKFGVNGTVLYVSFVAALAEGDNTGYGGLSLYDDATERLLLGDPGLPGQVKWGLDIGTGDPRVFESPYVVNATPRLLIARVNFAAANAEVRLYVDPPLDAEPATPDVGPITLPSFRFNRIRLESGPGSGGSPDGGTHDFDAVRIGTTYAAVAPVGRRELRIVRQPVSTNIAAGLTATFSVTASGNQPLGYQWFFNASPLANQTNATLELPNVQQSSAGTYHVRVSDDSGSLDSALATLTVFEVPDLQVTKLSAPAATYTDRAFEVKWSVANKGKARASGEWVDRVYLSPGTNLNSAVLIGEFSYNAGLAVGQAITRIQSVSVARGGITNGNYHIIVVTDAGNAVVEGPGEGNNLLVATSLIQVTRVPLPDLIVESIEGPPTAYPGQRISVRYVVRNIGDGPTDNPTWPDGLFLSSDTIPELEDPVHHVTVQNVMPLNPGEHYIGIGELTVATNISGLYNILVWTDVGSQVGSAETPNRHPYSVVESEETNNWGTSTPIQILTPPQPDLYVSKAHSVTEGFSDLEVPVTWTVMNGGPGGIGMTPSADPAIWKRHNEFAWPLLPDGRLSDPPPEFAPVLGIYEAAPWLESVFLVSADGSGTVHTNLGTFLHVASAWPRYYAYASKASARDLETDNDARSRVRLMSTESFPVLLYEDSARVKIPRVPSGDYRLVVVTDSGNQISERDEANNAFTIEQPIHVTLRAYPDLVVDSVTAPSAGAAGQPFPVTYTVRNQGVGTTGATAWFDSIYVSARTNLDASATLMANVLRAGALAAGASYTVQTNCYLPACLVEPGYLFVVTDSRTNVSEFALAYDAEANNTNRTATTTRVTPAPMPNLQILSVTAPAEGTAGRPARLTWVGINTGATAASAANWVDRVLLLDTPQYDSNRGGALVADVPVRFTVPAGATYTNEANVLLPSTASGALYFAVQADSGNAINECLNETDNLTVAGSPSAIAPFQLPDFQVIAVVAAPTALQSGGFVTLSYTVTNTGLGYVQPGQTWMDTIYIGPYPDSLAEAVKIATFDRIGPFTEHASYSESTNVHLPWRCSGTQFLIVEVNAKSQNREPIIEADSANNLGASAPIQVTQAPLPDLVITNVVLTTELVAGEGAAIRWEVFNRGQVPTPGLEWSDRFYLSRDQILDATDPQVGWSQHSGQLEVGAGYAATNVLQIPKNISGPYYLFAVSDVLDRVTELDEDNNRLMTPAPTPVALPLQTDLRLAFVVAPPAGQPGQPMTFAWGVTNIGPNPTESQWTDALYLSTDTTWDIDDTLVARVPHYGILATGEGYRALLTTNVPPLTPGNYYVIARTDVRNQVRETDKKNNTAAASAPTPLDVIQLTLGQPYPNDFALGADQFYKITVPANETLRFTLDAASTYANNELFVRQGIVPDGLRYDFAYDRPYQPDQQVVVPQTTNGTYYALARSIRTAGPTDYTMTAEPMEFQITSVTPNRIGDNGQVTIRVRGSKIDPGVRVTLTSPGGALQPIAVLWKDNTALNARFILTHVPHGDYDLILEQSTGETAVARKAVTVEQSTGPILHMDHAADLRPRMGRLWVVPVSLANRGNVDAAFVKTVTVFNQVVKIGWVRPEGTLPRQSDDNNFDWDNDSPLTEFKDGSTRDGFFIRNLEANQSVVFSLRVNGLMPNSPELEIAAFDSTYAEEVAAFLQFAERLRADLQSVLTVDSPPEIVQAISDERGWSEFLYALLVQAGYFESGGLPSPSLVPADLPPVLEWIGERQFRNRGLHSGGSCAKALVRCNRQADLEWLECVFRNVWNVRKGKVELVKIVNCVLKHLNATAECQLQYQICLARQPVPRVKIRPVLVGSADPNEIIGPAGFGGQRVIGRQRAHAYTVFFENIPTATAHAQRIVITNKLDAAFEPGSLELKEIGFGSYTAQVPEGRSYYQSRVRLGADFNYLLADISAGLDIENRQIRWSLTAIDPATGEQPESASLGLLPPNTTNHVGEGFVSYTIKVRPDVPTGTVVTNQANIVFDSNEPIATPVIWNTIDAGIPSSAVVSLPAVTTDATFTVSWAGDDVPGESGLAGFDVYVSDNGSTFVPWLLGVTNTVAEYTGVSDHTYAFYSLARDNAGNVELPPDVPDAQTTLYFNSPPSLAPIDNYTVVVNGLLVVTNVATDPDLPQQKLTFSIARQPAGGGVTIHPDTGRLTWRPAPSQASTTNLITVEVTDNGVPPMSATRSFTVIVAEYLEPSLGELLLRPGDSGCLPINLYSSVGVTNLTLRVSYPTGRLAGLTARPTSTAVCDAMVTPTAAGELLLSVTACPGEVFQGNQTLAELCFELPPQSSAFVPVVIAETQARKANGERVINAVNREGRLTVVGAEPLLEAGFDRDGQPQLRLLGKPETTYVLEYAPSLDDGIEWKALGDPVRLDAQSKLLSPGSLGAFTGQGETYIRARIQ